ncbi:MAG: hypothetical protein ABI678_12895 [Kofleriaceae bacterium]
MAVTVPVVEVAPPAEATQISSSSSAAREAAPAPSTQLGFVFELDGAHWMILDVDPTTIEHHRAPHLVGDPDYPSATLVALRDRDQPAALRAWRNTRVIVDGSCTDTVRDFALISQVTGEPSYAEDATDESLGHWSRATIAEHGLTVVAAKLDHCTGTYARAATAPAAVPFPEVEDAELGKRAEAMLMKSQVATDARAALRAQYSDVEVSETMTFDKVTEISTKIARDPRTSTMWVSVHAHAEFSCGGPEVNFWGLYRMAGDQLVTVREQAADLANIEALVDLDGDGIPELLGSGWISPTHAFYDQALQPIVSYDVPFFGCPC